MEFIQFTLQEGTTILVNPHHITKVEMQENGLLIYTVDGEKADVLEDMSDFFAKIKKLKE